MSGVWSSPATLPATRRPQGQHACRCNTAASAQEGGWPANSTPPWARRAPPQLPPLPARRGQSTHLPLLHAVLLLLRLGVHVAPLADGVPGALVAVAGVHAAELQRVAIRLPAKHSAAQLRKLLIPLPTLWGCSCANC
jgi:hypothetical protein